MKTDLEVHYNVLVMIPIHNKVFDCSRGVNRIDIDSNAVRNSLVPYYAISVQRVP